MSTLGIDAGECVLDSIHPKLSQIPAEARLELIDNVEAAHGKDAVDTDYALAIDRSSRLFWPDDKIRTLLDKSTILQILECGWRRECLKCSIQIKYLPPGCEHYHTDLNNIAKEIFERTPRLFALLVFIHHPFLIAGFLLYPKYDHVLSGPEGVPSADDLENDVFPGLRNGDKSDPTKNAIAAGLISSFHEHRFRFGVEPFNNILYHHFQSKAVLPLVPVRRIGEGAQGSVDALVFYPGYGRIPGINESKIYARKVINRGITSPEIQMAQTIQKIRHPNIMSLIKPYGHGKDVCFLFPLAKGTLHDYLRRDNNSSNWQHKPSLELWSSHKCTIWQEVIGLADALHTIVKEHECMHCDLNPVNILVGEDSKLLIADFGRAVTTDHLPSTSRLPRGQPIYSPPDRQMTVKYDVWPLGCMMLEILVYTIEGSQGVKNLDSKRVSKYVPTDYFHYEVLKNHTAEIYLNPGVEDYIKSIRGKSVPRQESEKGFLDAILDTITSMLKIDVSERWDAKEVREAVAKAYNVPPQSLQEQRPQPLQAIGERMLRRFDKLHVLPKTEPSTDETVAGYLFESSNGLRLVLNPYSSGDPYHVTGERDRLELIPEYAFAKSSDPLEESDVELQHRISFTGLFYLHTYCFQSASDAFDFQKYFIQQDIRSSKRVSITLEKKGNILERKHSQKYPEILVQLWTSTKLLGEHQTSSSAGSDFSISQSSISPSEQSSIQPRVGTVNNGVRVNCQRRLSKQPLSRLVLFISNDSNDSNDFLTLHLDEDDGSRFIYHEYTNSLKLEICRENRDQLLLFNFKQKERAVGAGIPLTALDEAEKSLKTDKPKKVIKTTKICISFRSRLDYDDFKTTFDTIFSSMRHRSRKTQD